VLPIYQLNFLFPRFDILIVDEFLRLNGVEEISLQFGMDRLFETFHRLSKMYDHKHSVIFSSHFMNSDEYFEIYKKISERINQNPRILEKTLATVPENKRNLPSAASYPIHEFACVKYLSEKGYKLKIGPTKEKQYDEIMRELGFDIHFGYLLQAYALGSKTPDEVVHYIPHSRGPNNGQRIFFEDSEQIIKQKLKMSCDEALRYFCKISSVSGFLLDGECLDQEEIERLHGKKLKKKTIKLVLENIIKPYRGAS